MEERDLDYIFTQKENCEVMEELTKTVMLTAEILGINHLDLANAIVANIKANY